VEREVDNGLLTDAELKVLGLSPLKPTLFDEQIVLAGTKAIQRVNALFVRLSRRRDCGGDVSQSDFGADYNGSARVRDRSANLRVVPGLPLHPLTCEQSDTNN
jgi:hypothetical protein